MGLFPRHFLSAAALVGSSLFISLPSAALEQPVISAPAGEFAGSSVNGISAFKGIPYAKAPVGEQRWQPPQPVDIAASPFEASEYGASCPQRNKTPVSEDCLFINVFTPSDARADSALPVFVWIHGGGYVMGAGDLPDEVVARWVQKGMVVVSFNYRLGALGIFAHPQLKQPEGANFSVMDMTAALAWVQDNIDSFGGDADKVTIAGNSAGGMAIQMMMVTAKGDGKFRGAISQSGYGSWPLPRTSNAAEKAGSASAEAISMQIATRATGSQQPSIQALRETPASAFVNAIDGFHLPVVDGITLTDEPATLFGQGRQHGVPYISGGNSYDGSVYPYAGEEPQRLLEMISPVKVEVTKVYELGEPALSALPFQHLFGDMRYVLAGSLTTQAMAKKGQPGYRYFFDVATDDKPGAGHGSETGALFSGNEPAVKVMQSYWANFILTNDPNGEGLPKWRPVSDNNENWMVFDDAAHLEKQIREAKLNLLESAYHQWNK